jgi:hypothetical protein
LIQKIKTEKRNKFLKTKNPLVNPNGFFVLYTYTTSEKNKISNRKGFENESAL